MIVFGLCILTSEAGAQKKTSSQMAAQFENRICGVNPNRTLFRNPKYEETVLFFQNHEPKELAPIGDFLATYKTKPERAKRLKGFVTSNYAMMRNMDDVMQTIGDRMISKKLAWLGVEKSPDEMDLEKENELFKQVAAVETQLKKDKFKEPEIKNFLLLEIGPILYSRWKNAQLRMSTILVALDDMTIRLKSAGYKNATEQKATVLLQAVPGSGIRTSDMEQIIDISQVSLFSGVKERTPEFQALVAKIKKPEVKKLVEDYRKWIEQGVDSFGERDEAISKSILAQKGMGLLLLSANSGPGVSDRLMEACPSLKKKTK